MPLLRNKNQPYFPDPDSPNNYQCGPEYYCHPIASGDTIYSQFYQTPCNANEVEDPEYDEITYGTDEVTNGDFLINPAATWTIGTGWAWDNINFEMDFTPGTVGILYQQIPTLVLGEIYRVRFDMVRTAGSIQVGFGLGFGSNYTYQINSNGSYEFLLQFNDSDVSNDIIAVLPTIDFNGSITNISVELVQYSYWITNSSWVLDNGLACHVVGQTGDLDENVPNYIDAGGYYKVQFIVTNRTDGSLTVECSNVSTTAITDNGEYTFWLTPTLNGVIHVTATSIFDGCISDIRVYKLRNDYTAELIQSSTNIIYDISSSFDYFEDYVTLSYNFTTGLRANGCYTLNVYDQCLITSDNLAFNGDFVQGFTDWTKANGSAYQYDVTGDEMTFKFDPFGQGATNYVVNGDFSSGAAWTLNAGWTILGGKAVHTPGNTGTLFQTLTLPIPPAPILGYNYWITFKISNWTVGSINVALGSFSYNWGGNDTFISVYVPQAGGTVNLTITPTSNFDGELDDFALITTFTTTAADPLLNNKIQPLLTPGTYQVEYDIISSTNANIKMNVALTGQAGSTNTAAGSYSYTTTYNQNGGRISLRAFFRKTSALFPQFNYVAGEITVDNVSYKKVTPFDATYISECLNYNSDGFPRTKMIVGYCDQNAFGFDFANTGFKLQQRAEIRSIAPTYPKTTNIMKSGTGNARVAYSEIEKYWQIHTDFASETFHDAMSAIISCDHFQIGDTESDGVEYIAEAEDYTPNWQTDGSYSLATAVINVRVKEKGQVFNRHI